MSRSLAATDGNERQQLMGGAVALLVATVCIVALALLGVGSEGSRMALGVLSVVLFSAGALSIGKSGHEHA